MATTKLRCLPALHRRHTSFILEALTPPAPLQLDGEEEEEEGKVVEVVEVVEVVALHCLV